jgi:hypothetical protein
MRSLNPRRAFAFLLPLMAAVPLLPACSSKSGGTAMGNVVIKDENNYSSVSSLAIPVVPVASLSDLTFTWDGLTKDLLCHTAGTVDNVAFLQIKNQTQMQVEQKMAVGLIGQKQVAVYGEQHTMTGTANALTTAQLTKFDWYDKFTPATDFAMSSTTQYVMLFTHGTALGAGAMSMVFIQPTDGNTTTAVSAPNPCPDGVANGANNVLNFAATLSPMAVSIPTNGPWKVDWSEITMDNFGNPLNFSMTQLDKVEVGFFQGKTPADIQSDFVNIETDATALYTYKVPQGQNYIDLTDPPTSGGTFPGFAGMTDGTWAVAVISTADSVPAPLIFAVLQPQ